MDGHTTQQQGHGDASSRLLSVTTDSGMMPKDEYAKEEQRYAHERFWI